MTRYKVVTAFWVFILLGSSTVWAKSLKVPQQFKSISSMLEAASYGDEVVVAPGTYKENIILKKGVILRKNDLRGNRMFPISPNRACELIEEDNQKW